ncbi:MAG: hypothetical protein ACJ8GK_06290 [Luteimonas sp.]
MALPDLLCCLGLAITATTLMLLSRARAPLGADEGYLWYGVQQWRKGRMPHRDFKSYEPGRYAWAGLWSRLLGPGLLALRVSTHLFLAIALAAALAGLRSFGLPWTGVAAAALALALLSHPQHKQFEHGAALSAWAVFGAFWSSPSPVLAGCAGATVGLSLFLGFNLFLYFSGALLLMLAAGAGIGVVPIDRVDLASLAGGGLLGLLPFAWACRDPEFVRNFHQRRIATVLSRGASNLSLPRPWPWRIPPAQLRGLGHARAIAFQWLFLALFTVPLGALALALLAPRAYGELVPAAMLGLCLSHHASSRADPPHMLQSSGPLCVLGVQACGAHSWLSVLVAVACLWLCWPLHPLVQRRRDPDRFVRLDAGGWTIDTPMRHAHLLDAVVRWRADTGNATLYAAPAYPDLYARLALDAPVYDTFSLYAASPQTQQQMIDQLACSSVGIAVVSDAPMDGRDALRFSATHALVWKHLHEAYGLQQARLGPDVHVFLRRGATPPEAPAVNVALALPAE